MTFSERQLPQIPDDVAMGMRFDSAPSDAILPLDVIACGTGFDRDTIRNWQRLRSDAPQIIRPPKSQKIYLRKRDVLEWIEGKGSGASQK